MERNLFKLSLTLLFICTSSVFGFDIETQNILIEKLEGSLSAEGEQTVEKDLLLVRLADLYAERARFKAIKEAEKKCNNCEQSTQDRESAIKYYKRAERTPDNRVYTKVVLQLNHLYKVDEKWNEAFAVLKAALRKVKEPGVVALIHFEIAEFYFKNNKYKTAKKYYQLSLKNHHIKKSQTLYKLAWSNYHLGNTKTAITLLAKILKDQELLKTEQSVESSYDETYHEIVAKDYANLRTLYVINSDILNQIYDLSPESSLQIILSGVANELTRLGRYNEATKVWTFMLTKVDLNETEKLSMWLNKLEGELASRSFKAATSSYATAVKVAKSINGDEAEVSRNKIRNALIRWHKLEAEKPSEHLFNAYTAYLQSFKDDVDMYGWASDVALKRKNTGVAKSWLRKSAKAAKTQKQKEELLLAELLMVEGTNNSNIKLDTYDYYLENSQDKKKSIEVLYQKGYLLFQNKQYEKSAIIFEKIVNANVASVFDLKRKAARLEIESLIFLKEDEKIVHKTTKYKNDFKQEKVFFEEQRVQGILNVAFKNKALKDSTKKTQILSLLKSVPLKKQIQETQKTLVRHLITYTDDLNELELLEYYTGVALNSKMFVGKEKARIANKHLWSLEMQLKFKKAHSTLKRYKYINTESDILKYAVISELAGQSADNIFKDYIKKTKSIKKANAVRAYLIENSAHPWSQVKKYKNKLMRTPDIWASVVLDVYLRTGNKMIAKKEVKTLNPGSFERQYIERDLTIDKNISLVKKVFKHRFNNRSQYLLNKSIESRIGFLNQIEKSLDKAIKRHDAISEVILANALADLNRKTAKDIMKLPEPKGLTISERKQYKKLITAKAKVFDVRAKSLDKAADKIANNNSLKLNIKEGIASISFNYKEKLKTHFDKMKNFIPSQLFSLFNRSLANIPSKPSNKEVKIAWNNMKDSPFESSKLEKVLEVEKQRGQELIVGYLSVRKDQLQRRKRQ